MMFLASRSLKLGVSNEEGHENLKVLWKRLITFAYSRRSKNFFGGKLGVKLRDRFENMEKIFRPRDTPFLDSTVEFGKSLRTRRFSCPIQNITN